MSTPDQLFTREVNGELYLSPRALARIFGVAEQQVIDLTGGRAAAAAALSSINVPYLWIQNGRRRVREAFAVIGDEDLAAAITYLDRLDGGSH